PREEKERPVLASIHLGNVHGSAKRETILVEGIGRRRIAVRVIQKSRGVQARTLQVLVAGSMIVVGAALDGDVDAAAARVARLGIVNTRRNLEFLYCIDRGDVS